MYAVNCFLAKLSHSVLHEVRFGFSHVSWSIHRSSRDQPVSFYFSLSRRVHFCLPSAVPLTNVGIRAGKEGDRVSEWGTGALNAW